MIISYCCTQMAASLGNLEPTKAQKKGALSCSQESHQRQLLFPGCGLEVTVQQAVLYVLEGLAVWLAEEAAFSLLVLKLISKLQ